MEKKIMRLTMFGIRFHEREVALQMSFSSRKGLYQCGSFAELYMHLLFIYFIRACLGFERLIVQMMSNN